MLLAKRDIINVTIVQDRPVSGFETARKAMIDSQLRTSGVNADFVLRRMAAVPREDFVPAEARGHAYMDRAIALPGGGHLPSPVVQGMMLQEAVPSIQDRALVVDGGSGYLAELVRPLVGSLNVIAPAKAAEQGDKGEYTLLLVDGAAERLPGHLVQQLAEGGRIVTGMLQNGVTRLAVGRKVAGAVSLLPVADLGMPAIAEMLVPKGWSF